MKKIKSRLVTLFLSLMICLAAFPSYTLDVYATSAGMQDGAGDDKTQEDDEETLQEIKKKARQEIADYANIMKVKVSEDVAKEIDRLVKKYKELIGTANGDKNEDGLASESGVSDCVTEAKSAIDALISGGDADGNGISGDEPATPSSTSDFIMVGGNWITPVATYGQVVNVVLPVVNMGAVNLANVTVTPVTSNLVSEWPFEIETSGYTQTIRDLPGKGNGQSDMDRRRELTWTLRTRADALSGYYKLQFNVLYYVGTEAESATLTTYVKVNGAPGSGNVEAEGGTSTPRVIITGFDTNPKDVHAGDTFTLTLHLKNTSQRTAVSNMLVNLSAPSEGMDADSTYAAFLPTSGSNTEYISKIGKGETVDLSIEMTAKADLTQKPYQIDVSMEYEDEDYSSYSSTADVSIPILQEARFELSTPEILPASISVGNEANIMFSLYNTGKITLYNVKVYFEDDTVSGGENFLGKIEAGGTGSVDALVAGAAPSVEDDIIKVIVEYEDEAGKKSTYEQELTLTVTEDMSMGGDMGMYMDDGMMEEVYVEDEGGSSKTVVIVTLVIVVLAAIIAVVIVLLRKRKRKKEDEERVNLLEELEGEDDSDEIS
ncbi:MAG: hypothetical protein E7289_09200 [Lachnospiraceae bacterium]|nr:hypothetical protein [Lachnospiraceae bacterium]